MNFRRSSVYPLALDPFSTSDNYTREFIKVTHNLDVMDIGITNQLFMMNPEETIRCAAKKN